MHQADWIMAQGVITIHSSALWFSVGATTETDQKLLRLGTRSHIISHCDQCLIFCPVALTVATGAEVNHADQRTALSAPHSVRTRVPNHVHHAVDVVAALTAL